MKHYYIDSIGVRLCYQDLSGEDTPIVFIHGLGCASSFDYPAVVTIGKLNNHRRVLVDLLGSGFSDKPNSFSYEISAHAEYLKEFLTSLGFEEFYLYAHSMGGAIALELVNLMQSAIKGIILSESNLDNGGGMFSQKVAAITEADYVRFGHENLVSKNSAESETSAICWSLSMNISSPQAIYRESISLINGRIPSWREILYSLDIPKTYLFGSDSLPDSDFEILPYHGVKVDVVPDAGHSMAWENPTGLASAIANALGDNK
ncbi:alpha/beta hydrolase [Vibrio sp. DW001]|uniref:alpha/beta fold hydrolase n=1 Tax=Vibrio sp. DW001 TaxID=2912315 RepID=UPI0023AED92E|nr:alpha/beta hydrolase [Vibrio sp. DW001]WED25229.1 alpha/beta hydrolase [Vibrio sp. DW001]